MPCNLFRAAWSNMIGNVGEARHGQGRRGGKVVAATAAARGAATAAWHRLLMRIEILIEAPRARRARDMASSRSGNEARSRAH